MKQKEIIMTKRFQADLKKISRSGSYDLSHLEKVIDLICMGEQLPLKYKDHALIGNWNGRRECHIKPDWLLIYIEKDDYIELVRTGSHSQLFG